MDTKNEYICTICDDQFNNFEKYEEHGKNNHGLDLNYAEYMLNTYKINNIKIKFSWKMFCPKCKKTFTSKHCHASVGIDSTNTNDTILSVIKKANMRCNQCKSFVHYTKSNKINNMLENHAKFILINHHYKYYENFYNKIDENGQYLSDLPNDGHDIAIKSDHNTIENDAKYYYETNDHLNYENEKNEPIDQLKIEIEINDVSKEEQNIDREDENKIKSNIDLINSNSVNNELVVIENIGENNVENNDENNVENNVENIDDKNDGENINDTVVRNFITCNLL